MAQDSTRNWRCRECLSQGVTADFASASHMKSHLSTHGYGPWRCTECNFIGLRKETITSHHCRSGETTPGAYNDPALNTRVNSEVRECLMPHRNTWTGRTAMASPDARALATARAAAIHHAQTHVATASPNHTATAMTTMTSTTIVTTTTTTTTIKTMTTSTNASATASAEQEMIASNIAPVTTPAFMPFANQALEVAIPFINRLKQMQDCSHEYQIQACLSSLQPIITELQRQHTVKGHRRNVYLVATIMGFYHDLLTTDEEAETINAVARELKELRRDIRE